VARATVPPPGSSGFARPFRLNLPAETHGALVASDGTAHAFRVAADGTVLVGETMVAPAADAHVVALDDGFEVRVAGNAWRLFAANPAWEGHSAAGPSDGQITAPMPGKLLSLHVRAGDTVKAGDRLLVLEAMKMEHRLTAPFDGTVGSVAVEAGQQVAEGALLLTVAPA
jgi:biotin carboxyl carrier protein